MAGLPKKYAKMGFKKGWAAYKKTKRSPYKAREVTPMARRRKYTRTRGAVRYARKASGGSLKPIIDGFGAGILGAFLQKWIGAYGQPAAAVGVGYFRNQNVLKVEGARELGALVAQKIPFISNGGGGNGGLFA